MDEHAFYNQLQDTFGFKRGEALDPSDLFKKHNNWGSITSLLTIAMFFDEYKVQISSEELVNCDTFKDLYVLVQERMGSTCTA